MGRQKLLLPLGNKPLAAHVLSTVRSLPWADCVAVIGEPAAELAGLCARYSVKAVYNAGRARGQSTSIVLALQTLPQSLAGMMFFLGDQPLVSKELIQAIRACFARQASDKAIIVPCHQGQRYSPVLFGSHWRAALAGLTGDTGGRKVIRENPAWVTPLKWPEPAPFYDADTWAEYQQLLKLYQAAYAHTDNI
ncbi:nucleotidyltransferase family protein [Sporomusa termitida]|uniref:Molybdenum cofactor cytidylyltransferase n=1 Tax=Sporomusa termitida TaxID=2377 RepID=A0A517DXS9_9FIRM|nr:nucleotidyltransferase family protein [Sporomusa termitida]QDR82169.1 molybdenum cofactor cytidylyltransferase [Sporomusa termitida]